MTPAVLLLHGFTHTGASWDPVVAALGERYRALTPDIRGHGAASDAEPVTLAAVLADLDALAPQRFTLAGYSMGGRLALHAAFEMPDRVDRLILIGASPGIADHGEREQRRRADETLAAEIERSSIEEFARRWAQTPVLDGLPAEVLQRAQADRLRSTPSGLARALRGLGTGALPPLWDRLAELRTPVTLVVGERDRKFRAIAERMARADPDAPEVGHPGRRPRRAPRGAGTGGRAHPRRSRIDRHGAEGENRDVPRHGASRKQIASTLNTAYADGLLSHETFLHRLDQLFERRLIDPVRLIGDLSTRGARRRPAWFIRAVDLVTRWPRATGVEPPAVLLALDWSGGPGELILGRHHACDVLLSDPSVSRRHARLIFRDGSWVLQDLDSTNGTLVNGVQVGRCALRPGDRLALGDEQLRID